MHWFCRDPSLFYRLLISTFITFGSSPIRNHLTTECVLKSFPQSCWICSWWNVNLQNFFNTEVQAELLCSTDRHSSSEHLPYWKPFCTLSALAEVNAEQFTAMGWVLGTGGQVWSLGSKDMELSLQRTSMLKMWGDLCGLIHNQPWAVCVAWPCRNFEPA